MKQFVVFLMAVLLLGSSMALGATDAERIAELERQVSDLKAQQSDQALAQRNAELVRQMVGELATQTPRFADDTALTAGYDKRFYIKSADDQFKLELDTRLQFRWSYLQADDGDNNRDKEGTTAGASVDSSGNAFEVERAKLILSGHVLKDVKYRIQLEMDDDSGDDVLLQDYEVAYSFMPELGVRVGRFKTAFGKQENTSSGAQMLVDRSLANEVFNISRGTGVELFGACPFGDTKVHYRAGAFNSFREADINQFANNDNNPALVARLEVPLMGATQADFSNESDLVGHENPVALVGVSFAYNNSRTEDHFSTGNSDNYDILVQGGDGCTNMVELGGETTMFAADVSYKCSGLSVTLEGFYQHTNLDSKEVTFENDFGTGRDVFGINGLEVDNYGWYAQAGYFIVPQVFEIVSRASAVCVDNSNDSYEYAGGWNWYLAGQDLKLSMDITYIDDLPLVATSPNFDGMQNNALFLIRTQLQFQF